MRLPTDSVAFWRPLAALVRREMEQWSVAVLRGPLTAGDVEVAEVCRGNALCLLDELAASCRCRCDVPWCPRRVGRQTCLLMGLALVVGISPARGALTAALVKEMGRDTDCNGR
jgi:hypothetical protein